MPRAVQQHPASGLLFFLFIFIIWVVVPDGELRTQSLLLAEIAAERLARCRQALDVLGTSSWGHFRPADGADETSYLNLTGFRREDGFAWEDLDLFREKGLRLSHHENPLVDGRQLWDIGKGLPVWANASGTLHGEWVRREGSVSRTWDSYNLSESVPSMHWSGHDAPWARNITGDEGTMLLRIETNRTVMEYDTISNLEGPLGGGSIRGVKGTATIDDGDGSGLSWEMRLYGVHWPKQGVVMMTTTSEKFEGIFGLPHLTPSRDWFQSSQLYLNQSVARAIAEKEEDLYIDQAMPWNSDLDNPAYTLNPTPHCEYVLYAQMHSPDRQALGLDSTNTRDEVADVIHAIESELQSPQGAPVPPLPDLEMSAVIYSPDCAFFLETKGPPDFPPIEGEHLVGTKSEIHIAQIKSWILVYAVVVFAQMHLMRKQMKESYTPSTLGRVSFLTTGIMTMVDGMTFTAAATWVSSAASTFLPTLALMFASFLSMTVGMSFLAKIHEVQLPETRPRQTSGGGATTSSPTPGPRDAPDRAEADSLLPVPVTARPLEPIIIPSDQDIDAEILEDENPSTTTTSTTQPTPPSFQTLIGRAILLSLTLIFLAISSTTWVEPLRTLFLNICALAYLSLWLPQIHRNIMRNCRRALSYTFIIGQSLLRLLPIAYFWLKEDNFLYATTDTPAFLLLAAWVWLQLVVLVAQDALGPRFGVPKTWVPEAWDYHPVLREDNLEAGGLPIGLIADDSPVERRPSIASTSSEKRGAGIRAIDCIICRETLEAPVVKAGEDDSSVAGALARRNYMVTPCRHIFHTACLEGWMRFRLQCPICREELPPL